jgi:murein DD-endopeptidase MepM/ murein hydrolase activator NlpD
LPFFVFVLLAGFPLCAQDAPAAAYPRISRMNNGDPAFKQYRGEVDLARLRPAGEEGAAEADGLAIYSYVPAEDALFKDRDLFDLASRCLVHIAAVATLNRLSAPVALKDTGTLLLPTVQGIFIPENPRSDLEMLLDAAWEGGIPITLRRGDAAERFRFFPGADFSPTERTFFLVPDFRFPFRVPLKTYRLTSAFGPRVNPVTGRPRFHQGLDLAAPMGTEVYPAKAGSVAEQGEDPVYGKYIVIRHDGEWASLYGHLAQINTVLHGQVESSTIIGRVGSTGQSTGPHLHFELRRHGKAQDPGRYLFQEGGGR